MTLLPRINRKYRSPYRCQVFFIGELSVKCVESQSLGAVERKNPRVYGVVEKRMGITSEIGVSSFSSQYVS